MSTAIVFGNVLDVKEGIIAHQVNMHSSMGGGIARALADKYPDLEPAYAQFIKEFREDHWGDWQTELLGNVFYYEATPDLVIANCFSQFEVSISTPILGPNMIEGLGITSYNDIQKCFCRIRKDYGWDTRLTIPFKYGSGIAGGSWTAVESLMSPFDVVICARPKDYEDWINEGPL